MWLMQWMFASRDEGRVRDGWCRRRAGLPTDHAIVTNNDDEMASLAEAMADGAGGGRL